jgi:hypothetical protein
MSIKNLLVLSISLLWFSGCSYSDSALQYATEGTKRADAGYTAKTRIAEAMLVYLTEANKGCGVKVEVINGVPVTTVRECIRPADVLASVDKVEIIKPQQVKDILDSVGDFAMKATNLVVPVSSIYFGYKTNKDNQAANIAVRQSDNNAQSSMWANYTDNFENTTSTTNTSDTSSTASTASTITNTTNTTSTTIPSVSVDSNGTVINQ